MQVQDVPNLIKVGTISESKTSYKGKKNVLYSHKLEINYVISKEDQTKHQSIVYIFAVNNDIVKIGQSSAKGGIRGCMSFYMSAGQDNPGANRFTINWLIRKELDKGNVVDVYMLALAPIEVNVPGLFQSAKVLVPVSAKGMEELCLNQFTLIEGCKPIWNFQEKGEAVLNEIREAHGNYLINRTK